MVPVFIPVHKQVYKTSLKVRPAGLHDVLQGERLAQVPGQLQLAGHEGGGGLQLPVKHLHINTAVH